MSELDLTAAAKSLFQWDIEHHREPRPTWDGLTNDQRDVWHSAALAVLPHIREQLSQQVESAVYTVNPDGQAGTVALSMKRQAARIVRALS